MALVQYKLPGHVLVRFKDDPLLLHHRWVIKKMKNGKHWVVTPDRERFG